MGRHSKRRRRSGGWIVIPIAILLLVIGILLRRGNQPADGEETETGHDSAVETMNHQETAAPTPTPTPWNLVLVNRSHPVPADWTVTPVALPNGQTVDARIYEPLMEMFEAARSVNLDLLPNVESGYRSEEKQRELFEQKCAEYLRQGYSEKEAKALTEEWVSVPGTSEHQLGIAVDISGAVYAIYPWLQENAFQYGFILRYPADKTAITGFAAEEWHYRYVGIDAATEMHERGLCLEEYLEQMHP